jgi:hypothetical protein
MNRQEVLLNLTLVTIIGALGYSIYESHQNAQGMSQIAEVRNSDKAAEEEDAADTGPETTYDRTTASKKFPAVGNTDLFKAILTPTPAPPTPTPKPTDTPNIVAALNAWKLLSVDKGVATIEDVIKSRAGAEDAVFDMKAGDTRVVDIGGNQTRPVKLESTDETSNPDQPTATFSMQDTKATRTLKMGEEAGNATSMGDKAQVGVPGGVPVPGAAPQ